MFFLLKPRFGVQQLLCWAASIFLSKLIGKFVDKETGTNCSNPKGIKANPIFILFVRLLRHCDEAAACDGRGTDTVHRHNYRMIPVR